MSCPNCPCPSCRPVAVTVSTTDATDMSQPLPGWRPPALAPNQYVDCGCPPLRLCYSVACPRAIKVTCGP